MKWYALLLIFLAMNLEAANFDPVKDTFAFGNETLWAYGNQHRAADNGTVPSERPYSRRCFVMCRAAMQFHQFARFTPGAPQVSDAEYRQRIRRIARIPVSEKRNLPKIDVPGFANLQSFSRSHPTLLQENLGNWWPSYLRLGNWRMGLPFPRSQQKQVAEKLMRKIDSGALASVYITRFKPLNHCLVVHGFRETKTGVDFSVYDPNLPRKICHLTFDSTTSSFEYQKTWYHKGGRVNVIQVYHTRWF